MTNPTDDDVEHPAARRMRLDFEAKYGEAAPLMRAASHWFTVQTDFNEPWNRDRQEPVTSEDVDKACRLMLAAGTVNRGRLQALDAAVSALYFDDASKYQAALYSIVRALDPSLVEELLASPKAAFDAVQARFAAAS